MLVEFKRTLSKIKERVSFYIYYPFEMIFVVKNLNSLISIP